jgi:DNA-directed RNA polymerase subunit H (RpoH/RPB5)
MSPARPRAKKSKKALANAAPTPPPRPFTAHHLVPPHEMLSESAGQEALKALGTSIERLPKILVTDPGLKTDTKFVAAREKREALNGRIIRIRRPSSTAGEAVAYRVLTQQLGE